MQMLLLHAGCLLVRAWCQPSDLLKFGACFQCQSIFLSSFSLTIHSTLTPINLAISPGISLGFWLITKFVIDTELIALNYYSDVGLVPHCIRFLIFWEQFFALSLSFRYASESLDRLLPFSRIFVGFQLYFKYGRDDRAATSLRTEFCFFNPRCRSLPSDRYSSSVAFVADHY